MSLIIKYLKYFILLNLNYIVIFFHYFFNKKFKLILSVFFFYALRNVLSIDFEIKKEIYVISLKFKRDQNIFLLHFSISIFMQLVFLTQVDAHISFVELLLEFFVYYYNFLIKIIFKLPTGFSLYSKEVYFPLNYHGHK